MKIKKVINIEDTILKHIAIKRALNKCGIGLIDQETTAISGIERIEEAIKEGNPYDLLVVDMHFPIEKGQDDFKAGEYVINTLKEKGINIPIILCSSVRYNIPNIEGCIFYNEKSGDLDSDMRELIEDLKNK
jgi:CheY-like chemotaxis protein